MATISRDFETRCERMKRRCGRQFLSTMAKRRDYIFIFDEFFRFLSTSLGQGSSRCSRLFPSYSTRRSILPGQFRRSKNIRLTRRPYHHLRKSITPVRRSVRWVAKMYGRHAMPGRLSLPVALMPGYFEMRNCVKRRLVTVGSPSRSPKGRQPCKTGHWGLLM